MDLLVLQKKQAKQESLVIHRESLNRQIKQNKLGISSNLDVSESNASFLENKILLADLNQSLHNSINQFKTITGWRGNLTLKDQNESFQNFISLKRFKNDLPP